MSTLYISMSLTSAIRELSKNVNHKGSKGPQTNMLKNVGSIKT